MESEKVKEIKEALEDNKIDYLPYIDGLECKFVAYADILTYINELESELKEEQISSFNCNTLLQLTEKENQKLKDRIALLEKDNELLRNAKVVYENVDYCYEDLKKAEKRIAELEKEIEENAFYSKGYADGIKNTYEVVIPEKLKKFAEKLKDKAIRRQEFIGELAIDDIEYVKTQDIDETLKEVIND